jgi:hypothetical protein
MIGMRSGLVPVLVLVALAPFAAVVACGGAEPPPAVAPPTTASGGSSASVQVTNSTPGASASATTPAPAPLSSASAAALAAILTTDPAQVAVIVSAAASASPAKTGAASGELAKGLDTVAMKGAPGMKPEGAPATGTLKEGDHLAWSVTLAPGKCYAIVGYSPSGEIQDLDLHVLSPPFFSIMAGEDTTDDNAPVVGASPNFMCPVVPVKLPYKVDITSQKGSGRAAVQLFSKRS